MKLNKLQEISQRQFNELRNKINERKEYYTKDNEILKETKQNLELINSINEMKNVQAKLGRGGGGNWKI